MNVRQLISQAHSLHQQGQLDAAAEIYARILEQEPRNFFALQLLGVLRGQQGRNLEAKRLLQAALELQPGDFGVLLNYGQVLMGMGQYKEALDLFSQALAAKPDFFEALFNRGVALAQLKRHAEAVASFDRALALNAGGQVACHYNRALSLAELDRHAEALAAYDRALAGNPDFSPAWGNRGNSLKALKRPAEALDSYDRALALAPRDLRVLYNRGNALFDLRCFEDALAGYDRALALEPRFAEAWFSRGIALMEQRLFSQALESFDRALALRPGDPEILNNRGVTLWHLKRYADARAAYDQALSRDPQHAATLLNRALLLQEAGQLSAALADYDKVIAIQPGDARAWNGRGSILQSLKRDGEALAQFNKALELDPALAGALVNRAYLRWRGQGDHSGAMADLHAALKIDPDQPLARGELLHLKMHVAEWDDFEAQKSALDAAVREGRRAVSPFAYQAISASPADLQACSRIFAESLFPALPPQQSSFSRSHGKIRIGYLSGEFREQATAYLTAGLYELHDREKFEIVAIDTAGGDASPMRKRLEAAFDRILYVSHLSDDEAVQRIRAEEIDILVNLNGYFGAPRMGIFARRAAPIQVNYLGFPATLGTSAIDYIIADRIVIPEDEQRYYDEQVVTLPHCYQVNDRKRAIAEPVPSRAALGLPEQAFVFCNFNQSYKITPDSFAGWMRILAAVDGSVLWLLDLEGLPLFRANLLQAAARHGIAPRRLVFARSIPLDQHLARLKQADLFLDTLPYNAHTTASDALWAGLPLLTCRGTSFPGRVAASLLDAVAMPELVTQAPAEFEARAIALARGPQLLGALKRKLAGNRLATPLFDTARFAKDIERAYARMWQAWKKGEPPKGFSLADQDWAAQD
ncbi:MAG TPA: tetratricopeptide repeat protein [Rhizomicrobium sp.]|nr:tetratricopeptide repeat protein [Rhizomicrobium sp.]